MAIPSNRIKEENNDNNNNNLSDFFSLESYNSATNKRDPLMGSFIPRRMSRNRNSITRNPRLSISNSQDNSVKKRAWESEKNVEIPENIMDTTNSVEDEEEDKQNVKRSKKMINSFAIGLEDHDVADFLYNPESPVLEHDDDEAMETDENDTSHEDHEKTKSFPTTPTWVFDLCKELQVYPNNSIVQSISTLISKHLVVLYESFHSTTSTIPNGLIQVEIQLIVDIISILPAGKKNGKNFRSPIPSEKEIKALEDQLKECEQVKMEVMDGLSQVSELAIARKDPSNGIEYKSKYHEKVCLLTKICKAYIDRFEWSKEESLSMNKKHKKKHEEIQKLSDYRLKLYNEHLSELKDEKFILESTREKKDLITKQIDQQVETRANELIAQGESNGSARTQAYLEMVQSKENHVIKLLQSLEDCKKDFSCQRQQFSSIQLNMEFLENTKAFIEKVISYVLSFIQDENKKLEDEKIQSDAVANAKLNQLIPLLCQSIHELERFLKKKQQHAEKLYHEKSKELASNLELFGNAAPLDAQDLKGRIQEYKAIVLSCTHEMQNVAKEQKEFWKSYQHHLPSTLLKIFRKEFHKLWKELDGTMQKTLADFISSAEIYEKEIGNETVEATKKVTQDKGSVSIQLEKKENTLYKVGDKLFTKFIMGGKYPRFYEGEIIGIHENGTYTMRYEDGDVHSLVPENVLYTKEQKEALQQEFSKPKSSISSNNNNPSIPTISESPTNSCCIQ